MRKREGHPKATGKSFDTVQASQCEASFLDGIVSIDARNFFFFKVRKEESDKVIPFKLKEMVSETRT